MTITLITPEQHALLLKIQQEHPILTFQNEGFEYIDKSKFSKEDENAFNEVTKILKGCIKGFEKFNNFRYNKKGELKVRFQYDWTIDDVDSKISFTGVGYLLVDELLNGFKEI